ncbi:MAG TPA: hypothetical protein PLP24_09930, partial [Acetivibrio thermocellus]|nr:hypothetical protein [Acetivibrio thermocellus]
PEGWGWLNPFLHNFMDLTYSKNVEQSFRPVGKYLLSIIVHLSKIASFMCSFPYKIFIAPVYGISNGNLIKLI